MESICNALNKPQIEISKIIEKGKALAIVADCSAPKPPVSSKVMATIPVDDAQKIRCHSGVSVLPPEANISITKEPESAEVTKNKITIHTATIDSRVEKGKCSKKANNANEVSALTVSARLVKPSFIIRLIEVLPKAVIHKKVKPVGTSSTPVKNSRMVRPRETRAINIPTKGDQESHQPQYSKVQPPNQSVGS